jgi:hypothetical protein
VIDEMRHGSDQVLVLHLWRKKFSKANANSIIAGGCNDDRNHAETGD